MQDAGDGYYLFRREMQKQLGELWALTEQLASRLEEATAGEWAHGRGRLLRGQPLVGRLAP